MHSTAEVSRILGMSEARVRELVRSGLCRPARRGRGYAFSFQDLVVLCAANGLMQQDIPPARVRRSLAALVQQLPSDRPLSGLRIYADGGQVAVRDGATAWHPETGQTVLDFGVGEIVERAEKLRAHESDRDDGGVAGDGAAPARSEFIRALDLEERDVGGARAAYQRALLLDPELVDAYVNLGRLVHEAGEAQEAAGLYRQALARSADDPVIHFNLALALEDGEEPALAAEHYARAIELDGDFADAYFNLARLCEQLGRAQEALRHYHAYKRLTEV